MRTRLLALTLATLSAPAFAQATWTQLSPASQPNARAGTVMCYDGVGLLFFSGNLGPSGVPSQFPSELWRYDGTNWSQLSPNPDPVNGIPDGRQWYAATFDLARGVYVVFGGQKGAGLANLIGDTWEYNLVTNTWSMKSPATSPTPRRWAAMEFMFSTGKCVLFGGETANSATWTDETWEWDGTNWTLLNPTNKPTPRGRGKMAYDPHRQELMYCFGKNSGGVAKATWIWDGTDWTRSTNVCPNGVGLYAHGVVYDLARRRYVAFGGADSNTGNPTRPTWEYDRDTDTWTDRTPAMGGPGARTGPALAYLPTVGKTILWGGYGPSGGSNTQLNDTWDYETNAFASFTSVGSGCATSAGVPNLGALTLPWIGESLTMEVANTPGTAATFCCIGTMPLTLSLGSIGIGPAGCVVLVNPTLLVNMPVSITTSRPTLTLPVPASPALIGGTLLNQALVVDLGAGRTYVSNRGDATFGAL